MKNIIRMEEDNDILYNILSSNGKSKLPYDYNILEYFYKTHKVHPTIYSIDGESIYYNWVNFKEKLYEEFGDTIKVLYTHYSNNIDTGRVYENSQILEIVDGVVISVKCMDSEHNFFDDLVIEDGDILLNDVAVLSSGTINAELLTKINSIFNGTKIKEIDNVSIGMVSMSDGEYYVKDFDVSSNVLQLTDLDLHYGEGFSEFSDKLIERMLTETKGLVLFHGDPGSGKTTMVRHILKTIKANNNNNNILYFPPSMIDAVTDPSFIDFISNWAYDSKGKNYLLIEDAEPLLESRDQTRNIGITNLLNMTDGLLNDILNIQIIATFNTDLKNIDKALLRPERLLGRKNFKKLTKANAIVLAEKIGVDVDLIKTDMSLADIYSLKNKTSILIHDIDTETKKIGFGK